MHIDLKGIRQEDILRILGQLDPNTTSVYLTCNDLGLKTAEELVQIFHALPMNLQSLNLGYNDLDRKTADELARILHALPTNLLSLDLGDFLNYKTADALVHVLRALPPNLQSLGLQSNQLHSKTAHELERILSVLPASLKSLNLRFNYLSDKNDEALIALLEVFRGRALTELKLDSSTMKRPVVRTAFDAIIGVRAHNARQKEATLLGVLLSELTPSPSAALPASHPEGFFASAPLSVQAPDNPTPVNSCMLL
ncbi:leucine-rich repeat-containing protein [Legionella geestiana]|uniref:Leucine-rich repeat-containing protein n=1 Tax=Legionella geestiana TaxID=45065 RepID=A0A0W0U3B2_9GAMM|nr:hypothetical protein [Legionella geestiana]KTD02392.1 leucine-rich repeat-containing protein [Legionella geestiana]QBS12134.1 hypothetical protein E4T54_04925 [Legionella geestiana]QDQ40155.1 hypothetical protein E3226_006930 [Legionella geestiana]STX53138.1 leucine-rich repeat-containing protein [Legionella geestiana]